VALAVVVCVFVAVFTALVKQVVAVAIVVAQTFHVTVTPVPRVKPLAVVVQIVSNGFPEVVKRFAARAGVVKIPNVSGIALAAVISVLKQKRQGNNTKNIKKRSGGMNMPRGMT